MSFLEKLRSLPESQRKLILWTTVALVALVLFIWWVKNAREKLAGFRREELRERFRAPEFPGIEMPSIELPAPPEEDLKQLEEQLKEMENAQPQ